jgi:hypothetical protein
VLVIAAVLYTALTLTANSLTWTDRLDPQEWVGHVALNALAVSVILHVAIGRRWPFQAKEGSATNADAAASPAGDAATPS